MDANLLIDLLGGTTEVARLCCVKPPSVSEWRYKGIPKARLMYLRLLRPEVFIESTHPAAQGEPTPMVEHPLPPTELGAFISAELDRSVHKESN